MSWKELLADACRSYDDKDLEGAKRKAKLAMREAATLGGEEGAKAVEEIHSWLNILEAKIASSTMSGKGDANRKENSAKTNSNDVRSGPSSPPTSDPTVAGKPSKIEASDVMQGLCGLALGAAGWWVATQGALKSFIDNLKFAHEKTVSDPYKLSPPSTGDGLIDLVNWLIHTAATIAVVWTSGWIGVGIGRFLAFLGSELGSQLERLADGTDGGGQQHQTVSTKKFETGGQAQYSTPRGDGGHRDQSIPSTSHSKGNDLGLAILCGGLPGFAIGALVISQMFRDSAAGSVEGAAIIGGLIFGVIGSGIAEVILSTRHPKESEEERARREAANLQRFYKGVLLEDAWKRSQSALKANFIVGTKQWKIRDLDTTDKTYTVAYDNEVSAGYDKGPTGRVKVDFSQTGELHFRETANGTMITFKWRPMAFGPNDPGLWAVNEHGDWVPIGSWMSSQSAAAKNQIYVFIDSYLGPPKLGGESD